MPPPDPFAGVRAALPTALENLGVAVAETMVDQARAACLARQPCGGEAVGRPGGFHRAARCGECPLDAVDGVFGNLEAVRIICEARDRLEDRLEGEG